MNYKLYTTSHRAWDAMIAAISSAQKSIYLEMYIFLDDTSQSHDFIGILSKKAREGVRVVIVADAYGSRGQGLTNHVIQQLRDAGVEFILFSNWLRRIHRKVLIVDKKIAFIGGVNIGKRFFQWNDLQLKLRGRIVSRILKSFAYTYDMAGGTDKKILAYRERKFSYKLKFWLLEHWPIKNVFSLRKLYEEKISEATKSIRIVTPYFTPPRWLMSLLDDAQRRNVSIQIIVPQKADIPIMDRVNYHYINKVHHIGATIILSKNMNHSKLLLIDEKEGLVGTQNVDLASFQMNAEVGLFFTDKKLIHEIVVTFEKWKQKGVIFDPKMYRMHSIDVVILLLSKILWPIL